ncbi:MAG: class I SAM-dependent methyltransferase [Bacteriovoracaceae bacterium]|nr:class I SAM-dependent methyltransferase [Bacteriovoracaceae bacterium]
MTRYAGKEELEILDKATNYNGFVFEHLCKFLDSDKKVLDFGAGRGVFAKQVAAKFKKPICVEVDPELKVFLTKFNFEVFESLDCFEDNSFDLIYSLNVLEHIDNDREILQKMYQKLKVGGQLFLYVPAGPILYSKFDKKVGHFRRYTWTELESKIIESKLSIRKLEFADTLGFLFALIYKLTGGSEISSWSVFLYDKVFFPLGKYLDFIFKKFFGKNLLVMAEKE